MFPGNNSEKKCSFLWLSSTFFPVEEKLTRKNVIRKLVIDVRSN